MPQDSTSARSSVTDVPSTAGGEWNGVSSPQDAEHSMDSTLRQWADNTKRFAERSPREHLYSGSRSLDRFAVWLNEPNKPANHDLPATDESEVAVLYDFASAQRVRPLSDVYALQDVVHQNAEAPVQAQLLFLRGYISQQWIAAVANSFDVDFEYFYQHVELYSKTKRDSAWTYPSLATRATQEPKLRMTTIGRLSQVAKHKRGVKPLNELRIGFKEHFAEKYIDKVKQEMISVGDSLLRGIAFHDDVNFTYSQDVSIWTKETPKGWFALAWLDVGTRDLALGPGGDWLAKPLGGDVQDRTILETVFKRAALVRRITQPQTLPHVGEPHVIPQNTQHLVRDYALGLDPSLARMDCFYALANLFGFAAASERDFLNMLKHSVHHDLEQVALHKSSDTALDNVLYNRMILSQHVERLEQNLQAIRSRESWPRSECVSREQKREVEHAGRDLARDYADLLKRAQILARDCDRGIRNIEHLESHAESKKAISQAASVGLLTRLALVFVPLSFLATFFGMNFRQFGQGGLPLWVFFAVTIPVFLITALLLVTRVRQAVVSICTKPWRKTQRAREEDLELGRLDR